MRRKRHIMKISEFVKRLEDLGFVDSGLYQRPSDRWLRSYNPQ